MLSVAEEVVRFGRDRNLVGVIATPPPEQIDARIPTLVVQNAGLVHRVGPNRIHVGIARALAASGIASLRFDLSGIGDSPSSRGSASYLERCLSDAGDAVDLMMARFASPGVVTAGVCSGADLAYALSSRHEDVVGAVLINGGLVDPDVQLALAESAQARIKARYDSSRVTDRRSWTRLLSGEIAVPRILEAGFRAVHNRLASPHGGTPDDVDLGGVDCLRDRGVSCLGVFAEGSVAWDLLELRYGPNAAALRGREELRLEFIAGCDHIFTPVWAQRQLVDLIREWLCGESWFPRSLRSSGAINPRGA